MAILPHRGRLARRNAPSPRLALAAPRTLDETRLARRSQQRTVTSTRPTGPTEGDAMSRVITRSLLAAALLVGSAGAISGCNRNPDDQAQKMAESQQKASEKTAEAMNRANEEATRAVAEGSEKASKAYDKANQVAEKQAAKAADVTGNAQAKVDETKEALRQKFETEIGKIDKRIIDTRTQLSNAANTQPPRDELAKTLSTVQDRSNHVREKLDELTSAPAANVETTKKAIETEIAEVKQTLDSIDSQT
jgi:hypothetical protein